MDVTVAPACLLAEALAKDVSLRFLLLGKAITCVGSVVVTVAVAFYMGVSWLINRNAKILFANHLFWMIELPLCYAFVYTYDYYRLSQNPSSPCDFAVTNEFALTTRFPSCAGIVAQVFSLFAFCIERAISTAKPTRYERVDSCSLGLFLAITSSVSAVLLTFCMLVMTADGPGLQYWYSMWTEENQHRYQILSNICLTTEFMCLLVFVLSIWKNSRKVKEKKKHFLSQRYQMKENKRIICTLIPVVSLHFLFSVVNAGSLSIFPLIMPNGTAADHKLVMEFFGQIHLYPLLASVVLLCLRRRYRKIFVPSVHLPSEVYFEALRDIFDQPIEPSKRC